MSWKKILLVMGVISVSVSLGVLSRVMELHSNEGESYSSREYENKRDMSANEKGIHEIENTYSTIILSGDKMEFELSSLTDNQRAAESSAPMKPRNNRTKLDLSRYKLTPRKTDKDFLIPLNDAPVSGVIKTDKNKPAMNMYSSEETQKNYMTVPIESVDLRWIKRIWE